MARSMCSIDGCDRYVVGRGWCGAHYARWVRHGNPLGGGVNQGEPLQFILNTDLHTSDECLIWPYARDRTGYGRVSHQGKVVSAHRLVCEMNNGPPPSPAHEAAHSCGKGHLGCIAPKHLRWATHLENHADRRQHGTNNAGESCGSAKLTETNVRCIRALWKQGFRKADIARRYQISETSVRDILSGRSWGHL